MKNLERNWNIDHIKELMADSHDEQWEREGREHDFNCLKFCRHRHEEKTAAPEEEKSRPPHVPHADVFGKSTFSKVF